MQERKFESGPLRKEVEQAIAERPSHTSRDEAMVGLSIMAFLDSMIDRQAGFVDITGEAFTRDELCTLVGHFCVTWLFLNPERPLPAIRKIRRPRTKGTFN